MQQGAGTPRSRTSTEAAVLVMPPFILPVPLQVPGRCPQQVKALPAHWQAAELGMLLLAWLIPVSTQPFIIMICGQAMNGLKTNANLALAVQCHACFWGLESKQYKLSGQAECTSRELFCCEVGSLMVCATYCIARAP